MKGNKIFRFLLALFAVFGFCTHSYAASHIQTLNYIVKYTLQQNPNILKSQAQLNAAQAATDVARGGYFPRIDARAAVGSGIYDTPYYEEHNAKLDEAEAGLYVVQPIFSGLSTYNLVKQRQANTKSAGFNESYTKERLSLAAIQVYLEVLRSYSLKILALDNVKIHKRALRRVRLRYHGGGGHKTDVDLAKGRTARSQSTLHTIEAIHKNARAAFLQVVGLESQRLKIPFLPKVPKTLTAAKKITLTRHPALLAAKERINAAAAAVNVNKSRFLPTIDIEASANSTHNTNGFPGRNRDFRALVVARYNFLNGGSDRAAISQAKQLYIAAMHNYQDIRRRAIENVTQTWDQLIADRKKLRELYSHVKSSHDVLYGYKKQFEMGRRTLLDVLNMENELFNSKVQLLNGKYAVKEDSYVLLADMGVLAKKFM
jgi:adhesin transport system outer membrane protein